MKIKKSWEEVTIGEFQRINKVVKEYQSRVNMAADDIDFTLAIISILAGKEVEDMSTEEFNNLSEKTMFIAEPPKKNYPTTEYRLGDETFIFSGLKRLQKDATVRELKAIQYIDALHLAGDENGLLDNLHKFLAVVLQRKGGKEYNEKGFSVTENAEIIKDNMTITDALGVQAFFLQLSKVLTEITHDSSESRKAKKPKRNVFKSLINSLKSGAGMKTPEE